MANRVFFTFHYKDVIDFRPNVVRNHWLTKPDQEAAGFYDASIWETAKAGRCRAEASHPWRPGKYVEHLCADRLKHLFTLWVRYEILKSFKRGNHLFGVNINSIKGKDGLTKPSGPNPFQYVGVAFSASGATATLWEKVGDNWVEYDNIDGSASYQFQVSQQYRGNGCNLGNWYPVYDWNADN